MKNKQNMTTGEVGRLCGVAPRTVTKWFDSGHLRGWRIPGSNDRRFHRDDVLAFLVASGMARHAAKLRAAGSVVLWGCSDALSACLETRGLRPVPAEHEFGVGVLFAAEEAPRAVVIDMNHAGAVPALGAAGRMKAVAGAAGALLLAVLTDDFGDPCDGRLADAGFHAAVAADAPPSAVADALAWWDDRVRSTQSHKAYLFPNSGAVGLVGPAESALTA